MSHSYLCHTLLSLSIHNGMQFTMHTQGYITIHILLEMQQASQRWYFHQLFPKHRKPWEIMSALLLSLFITIERCSLASLQQNNTSFIYLLLSKLQRLYYIPAKNKQGLNKRAIAFMIIIHIFRVAQVLGRREERGRTLE